MPRESKLIDKCPLKGVIDIVSKKWALLIVTVLGNRPSMRYRDISQELVGVSPKTLADTLKSLNVSGIVQRTAYNETPPRVEYSLTGDGVKLRVSILPLLRWSVERSKEKDCIVLKSALAAS